MALRPDRHACERRAGRFRRPALRAFLALGLLGLALCLAWTSAGCAAAEPAPAPLIAVAPRMRVELSAREGAPVTALQVSVSLWPPEAEPLVVAGVRSDAASPEERSLLDLDVHWTDYRGDQPRSTGQSQRVLLPFLSRGEASQQAPLVVVRDVALPVPEDMLARHVRVRGRIIGVDLQLPAGHTGGTLLALPEATLESFAPAPPGTLQEHLQSRSVPGIFLSASGAPAGRREEVLETLVEALPATPQPAREAIFAALLYLTGETHGRDIYRWSSWWKARKAAPAKAPAQD
jgi:hypothetical protein